MAETIQDSVSRSAKRRPSNVNRAGEPFGGGIPLALLAIAVTLLGFWHTFFSSLAKSMLRIMLQGWSSTGWLVLVLVQASLIRFREFKWHRVVGWSSLLVFAVLIVTSLHMMALMLARARALAQPFDIAKLFGYSDVTALPLLIIATSAAIICVRIATSIRA